MEKGVDPSKVILCGFSQGAGIAIHTGFSREVPIGGVIALCGCLPNDETFIVKEQAKHTPIMYGIFFWLNRVECSMELLISMFLVSLLPMLHRC